jgi:hypothetical protein
VQLVAGSQDGAARAFTMLQTWAEEQGEGEPGALGTTPVVRVFDMSNTFNEAKPQAVMDHLAGVAGIDYDFDRDGTPRVRQGDRIPHSVGESGLNLISLMA